jgi:site-specific DNA-cytosine methylase
VADGTFPRLDTEFTALFLFSGIGAGALGFLDVQVELSGRRGRFRSLGGVDLDPVACKDFERLTRSPAKVADLATMTPAELRAFAGERAPDVVFMSAPCKAFSGLMSPKKAATPKYVAMARLAVDGVRLTLDTWGNDGPKLILFENVPRIATRGARLLGEIRRMLQAHGYVTHEGAHNCGKIGNLAQSRQRFLLVARHAVKVPVFLYQPPEHPLRPCGDVLSTLALPGDVGAGRLHRMPEISVRTWARLAAIRPGKDWRDLATFDGAERPAWTRYSVGAWSAPSRAVAGSGTNGAWGVGDVRVEGPWRSGALGVVEMQRPFGTITGRESPSNGAFSLADVRVTTARYAMNWKLLAWERPALTITGTTDLQAGAPSIADVRFCLGSAARTNVCSLASWSTPTRTVTGASRPAGGSLSVADLRLRADANPRCYEVLDPSRPAGTITGNAAPGGGPSSLADLRLDCEPWRNSGVLGVLSFRQHAPTVTASLDLWAGWAAVADPRATAPYAEVGDAAAGDVGEFVAVTPRAPRARRHGRRPWRERGLWLASDPRVPSNPPLVVRWLQRDLDDAPPFLPVLAGRGDGSWHRPLTLLERAVLQGLPARFDGAPLTLSGTLSQISEHIGNAVPVGASRAIAGEMLRTLTLAASGSFMLSAAGGVWVKRRRNGSFPLYVDEALRAAPKKVRQRAKRVLARVPAAELVAEARVS